MNVAHIGLGEGDARDVGGMKHVLPGLQILPVPICGLDILKNEPHRLEGKPPGLPGGGASDIRLHRVRQGVHACGGGERGRQGPGNRRVQHRVMGDHGEVVHGVLVFPQAVRDDSGNGYLAAGSGGGRNGDQRRQAAQYPQQAAHLIDAPPGTDDSGSHRFGAVHGGAAAEGNDPTASLRQIPLPRLLYILNRGIGPGAVIDGAPDAGSSQQLLQRSGNSGLPERAVRNQQDRVQPQPFQQGRQGPDALQPLRFPVGQQRHGQPEGQLVCPAAGLYQGIHGCFGSPSRLISRRRPAMDSNAL